MGILKALVFMVLGYGITFAIVTFVYHQPLPLEPKQQIVGYLGPLVILVFTLLWIKLEKKTPTDFWLILEQRTWFRLSVGALLGMIVMAFFIGMFWMAMPLEFERVGDFHLMPMLVWPLFVFMGLSLMEELLFRAYPLIKLKELMGTRWAIYITSICFGLYHGLSPNAFLSPAIWGLTFGFLALWSRGLALPTGFHFGLNFVQSLIGEKPMYAKSVWKISLPDPSAGILNIQQVTYLQMGLLLTLGILLIEWQLRKREPPAALG